jgi:hypothetical protein
MKRICALLFLGVCLGVGVSSLSADEAKKDAKPEVKAHKHADHIARLDAAYTLIHYGREHNDPLALLTAAKLLHSTPTQPIAKLFDSDPDTKAKVEKALAKDDPNSPEALIAEVLDKSPSPSVKAIAEKLKKELGEKSRDLAGGPFTGQFVMDPGETSLYPPTVRGGEHTTVTARVLGPGNLQLTVSDPKEGLAETEVGNLCRIRFFQRATGKVNIIRKNLSPTPIRVYLYIP